MEDRLGKCLHRVLCGLLFLTVVNFKQGESAAPACRIKYSITIGVLIERTSEGTSWLADFNKYKGPITKTLKAICFTASYSNIRLGYLPNSVLYYNRQVGSLQKDLLIGPYFKDIAEYTASKGIPYIATYPLSLTEEAQKTSQPQSDLVIGMWPTWANILDAVRGYYNATGTKSLHILVLDNTGETLSVANALHNALYDLPTMDKIGFTSIDMSSGINAATINKNIQDTINEIKQTTKDVLVYATDYTKPIAFMRTMKLFFDQRVAQHLDIPGMRVTFVDPTLAARLSIKKYLPVTKASIVCLTVTQKTSSSTGGATMGDVELMLGEVLKVMNVAGGLKTGLPFAQAMQNFTKSSTKTVTGTIGDSIAFDGKGQRQDVTVTFVSPSKTIGFWNGSFQLNKAPEPAPAKIAVILERPYIDYKKDPGSFTGNDRFEGIAVDVLAEVSRQYALKYGKPFTYEFAVSTDGAFGTRSSNGSWTGLYDELNNATVAMLAGATFKTTSRRRDFDFMPVIGYTSVSFMLRNEEARLTMFQFLKPFSWEIWLALFITAILAAGLVSLLDYLNPWEEDVGEDKRFDGWESTWYTFLIITVRGSDKVSHIIPVRVLSVFLWFFALIVMGCYFSNLVAFMMETFHFRSSWTFEDLVAQRQISFGYVKDSVIGEYLEASGADYHKMVYDYVEGNGTFVSNHSEGVSTLATEERFVFICNKLSLNYDVANQGDTCNFIMSAATMGNLELAFPTSKHSTAANFPKDEIRTVFQDMQTKGDLQRIMTKWTPDSEDCVEQGHMIQLSLHPFSGIILFMLMTIVFAFAVLGLKLTYYMCRDKKNGEREGYDNLDDVSEEAKEKEGILKDVKATEDSSSV